MPIGEPTQETVPPDGGVLASPDGYLFVEIPPGAVPLGAQFSVQEVTNLAPSGIGPAWRLGPEGTTFPVPITLTFFSGATGRSVDEVTVAWQDDQGYWHRAVPSSVARDPIAQTLTVQAYHLSSWTLTTTPTAKDFKGAFSIGTSVNGPFVAAGDATFTFAGEDTDATYYLLSGTLVLPSTLGTLTCVPVLPDTDTFPLRTNVAELSKTAPARFDWGASGAWHVSCSDGTTRLVTVAFDTVGVAFPGCTRMVTRGEVAGVDAALGGVSWDCAGKGQTSGSWDYVSAVCRTPCDPVNLCKTGTVTCGTGTATCEETGDVLNGAECGTGQVCNAGVCEACSAGDACIPANRCMAGVTSCATGTSQCVESTTPGTPLDDGTTCGVDQVCNAGVCEACREGDTCTIPATPCVAGVTSCATGTSQCVESTTPATFLVDGSSCGSTADLVCYTGVCVSCTQGATCRSANPCTAIATYECSSGAAVCTDRSPQAPGFPCGDGLTCSAQGICNTCVQGAPCTPTNQPCATGGTTECGSGSPVCVPGPTDYLPPGAACGTAPNLVCNAAHQCLPCAENAPCTSPDRCMNGLTSCTTGEPVCLLTTQVANGTTCNDNYVCNAGTCSPCASGVPCLPTDLCGATGLTSCATGSSVCTTLTWRDPGAACDPGPNTYCNAGNACVTCNLGATCTPTNTCAASGAITCGGGDPVCADQGYKDPGTVCGDLSGSSVCAANGTCTPCASGATCTSTNLCAASATMECTSGPVCVDRTFKNDGSECGSGLACMSGECVASRTVSGSRTVTYWPDGGAVAPVAPADAASSTVAALVDNGSGWSTFPGSVFTDGRVEVPNVPTGTIWLRFQAPADAAPIYLDTAGGTPVDLGFDRLGRSNVTPAPVPKVTNFPLALATNWATNNSHQMQIVSSNADVWDRMPRSSSTNARNGVWSDNWFNTNTPPRPPLNLLVSSDVVTIFHLTTGTVSTRTYLRAHSRAERSGFVISPDGTTYAAPGSTLTAPSVADRTPATGTWSLPAFEALRSAMGLPATGTGPSHSLVIGASVGALTGSGPVSVGPSPTLFSLSVPVGATTSANLSLGTGLAYARVLNTTLWNEWREVSFAGSVSYVAPIAGVIGAFTQSVSVGRREAAPATTALAPALAPVRNLRIRAASGQEASAMGTASGFETTPLLLWDPPPAGTAGTPTSYVVEVFLLGANGSATTSTPMATFLTGSTSVKIPAGVLTSGAPHYVRVTARVIPSDPWATAPFRRIVVGAWAQTLSGILTPQ